MSKQTGADGLQEDRIELRLQFVELLFALAAAEVAIRFGELALADVSVIKAPAAYSHLTLALVLIATSWVGWSVSAAAGSRLPLNNVFTLAFIVLLLDVILVVFYFIIVRGVEPAAKVDAGHETFWVMWIFAVYVVWDFVTKAVAVDPKEPQGFWERFRGPFWTRGRISMQCAVAALVVWYLLKAVSSVPGVVATDSGLIALDLFYRSRKQDPGGGWSMRSKLLALLGALVFVVAFYWRG